MDAARQRHPRRFARQPLLHLSPCFRGRDGLRASAARGACHGSPVNVLLVVDRWLPQKGGLERYAAALADSLVGTHDRVRVVTLERAPGPQSLGIEFAVVDAGPGGDRKDHGDRIVHSIWVADRRQLT